MNNPAPITEFNQRRFDREIVASMHGKDDDDELKAARDRFLRMNLDAAAIAMWHRGELRFGWRNGDMTFELTETAREGT